MSDAAPPLPLKDFTRRALTQAGVTWPDREPDGGIFKLDLPEGDTRKHFEREFLRLAFERAKIEPGVTLVARGGEFLDRLIAFVRANASGIIEQRLPKTLKGQDGEFRPFGPAEMPPGAVLERVAARNAASVDVWIAFVARFVSDERAQRSLLVRVRGDGRTATEASFEDLLAVLDRGEAVKDHPLTRKVLGDRYALAQEAALQLAAVEGGRLQDGIYARLQKNLSRIRAYYDGLLTDLPASDIDAIDRIQAERRLKLTEELDNHKLRVSIEPFLIAAVEEPVREADWRLALTDGTESRFTTRLSLTDGARTIPALDTVLALAAPPAPQAAPSPEPPQPPMAEEPHEPS